MTPSKAHHSTPQDREKLKVLTYQARTLHETQEKVEQLLKKQEETIYQTEAVLAELGITSLQPVQSVLPSHKEWPDLRTWAEIVAEVEQQIDSPPQFCDILLPEEVEQAEQKIILLRGEFNSLHRFDKIDWAICGVAGILAALVDILLVQMPKHPGFLGGTAAEGGPLANWIRKKVNSTLSSAEIKRLEREHWVPYDPSTSVNLQQKVAGLGPSTHRFQSLGHDPIVGFLFGVKDILQGSFTAIDNTGKLVIQPASMGDATIFTMNLFDAIGRVFGHLQSDVATATGLPVPLMPLFQFLQFGKIGKHGYTIGEMTRIMYRSHYDFRHFLAMSVAPLMIEILVRLCYMSKRMDEGYSLANSIPFSLSGDEHKPKLHTMLFCAHLVATAANAGKVTISQNPLTINYSQWLAFFRYAIPQAKWTLFDKENMRLRFVHETLANDWAKLDDDLQMTWRQIAGGPILLT
ncbi:MAG: hypothetical protein R3E79_13065 [Caldilineaceae bacterium]